MAKYIDGYVVPVPKKNIQAYRKIAQKAGEVWMEHGALSYFECVGEDMKPGFGVSFPKLLKLKPRETAVFAYIVFASRAQRDRTNAKVMKDPRMNQLVPNEMPFDHKRMVYGGFTALVQL